jgi:signal transduction histidine kinase
MVKSAISEAAFASITLYHVSSATHASQSQGAPGEAPNRREMRQATVQLKNKIDAVRLHFDGEHHAEGEIQPLSVHGFLDRFNLIEPPVEMQQIWLGETADDSVLSLLKQQFSACQTLCTSPDMSPDQKAVKLQELNHIVVRRLLPQLTELRNAATAWQKRLLAITNMAILGAFLCIVASILFTRFGVIGPLLRDLDTANANLSSENDRLEQRVALRTRDLKLALEQAEVAHETRTRFLASVNHEMRTPLNGVLGVAALLRSTKLDERQKGFVETIVSSGQILVRLIDDVLDYVTLNAGKMSLLARPVLLHDVVEESLDLLRSVAEAKGLAFEFVSLGNIQQMVDADPDRLQQIIHNIVGNAVKFTSIGGVRITLRQETSASNVHMTICVEDSGIGIDAEKLERMYEPFDRAAIGVPTPGAGLGLAVTKSLVEEMSGEISASSRKGQGSCFTISITLPLSFADQSVGSQAA